MNSQFDPRNNVIRQCVIGIGLEERGELEEARVQFLNAWNEASNDFEKFIAAFFVARLQKNNSDKLNWLEISLQCAMNVDDVSARSAFPTLYSSIAKCYEALNDNDKAVENDKLAKSSMGRPQDNGPFYHGSKADLKVGDLLIAGGESNYQEDLKMNHIYFTAIMSGAGLAAALAKGTGPERIYIVEPTGDFENDPNVTDKKFPGNLTRSYRSRDPLRIVGEATEWAKQTSEDIRQWREKLAKSEGEIIN